MPDALVATITAFGIVFVAELGDKTQLLALGFGARLRLRTVAVGLVIGYGAASAIAALVGGVLGAALPQRPIAIVGGLLFVGFAALTLRAPPPVGDDATAHLRGPPTAIAAIASVAITIAIAEMGDKTQLATAALAAQGDPVAVWVGATGGEVAAGLLGAIAGRQLGERFDARVLRIASAAVFAGVGVVLVATAV